MTNSNYSGFWNKYFLALALLLSTFLLLVLFHKPVLNSISNFLVAQDPLFKADSIVVLGGSRTGNRIEAAVRLYQQGFGKKLVFTGYEIYPGVFYHHFMKGYAIKLGVPENDIISIQGQEEMSTRGESISNIRLLEKNNLKSFILVTSAYHTRRSKSVYTQTLSDLNYDMRFSTYPAEDPLVPMGDWWEHRSGQIYIFLEYLKLFAYQFNF